MATASRIPLRRVGTIAAIFTGVFGLLFAAVSGQSGTMFQGSPNDPAIGYSTAPLNNAVARLNDKLVDGSINLAFEGRSGYLQSLLSALNIEPDSQMLVFSKTSLQAPRITAANPRALFFADDVAVGWVRDSPTLEIAAHDAVNGVVFYTLQQHANAAPRLKRETACLGCHSAGDTLGVPGLLMFSTIPPGAASSGRSLFIDQQLPLGQRWGGWFVTGAGPSIHHLGNGVAAMDARPSHELSSVDGLFDADGYLSRSSDIAALLVFSHQTNMINLLTRAAWEARAADPALHTPAATSAEDHRNVAELMRNVAREVVDYLLFVDEAPLSGDVQHTSGFAERFSSAGPRDRKGRSLHELDLSKRLMKYPCSYLVYSPAFDAMPPSAKEAIYRRLWDVLSGHESAARYRSGLSSADRRAIVEILRDTKSDLPSYFAGRVS